MAHRNPNAKKPQKPKKGGNARRGNANAQKQARKANKQFGKDLNKQIAKVPWVANPGKPKGSFVSGKKTTVTTPTGHVVRPNNDRATGLNERNYMYTLAENTRNKNDLDTMLKRLDGAALYVDPSTSDTWTPQQRLQYDPITGYNKDLLEAAPLMLKTGDVPKEYEDAFQRGMQIASGKYSVGKSEDYIKKLNKDNYYTELLFNPETESYEEVPVLKLNAQMPEIAADYDLLGDYYDTWTYKKKGHYYQKPGAPEVPYEFDDDGNLIKTNYDYYTVNEDGSWETHSYTPKERQQFEDDWMIYRVLSNASSIEAREITKRMRYTAGWDEEATDSVMDITRDFNADMSAGNYSSYSRGNRKGYRSDDALVAVPHLFKNVGGYLKTYLFTPLVRGDTQTAVMNGLVNLAETCDYAGVGTRALLAPVLDEKFSAGIEYNKEDTAWERVARAYTTHYNYEPNSGNAAKDMATWVFTDPSIYLTLGGMAAAKLTARVAAKNAMKPLLERVIKYGDDLTGLETPLTREYKSIARDIAFADNVTLEKHAARVANVLKDTKYFSNEEALASEIINDLRAIRNTKSFTIVKGTAAASDLVNQIDTFFLAGGLYLPYSAIKTVKATRSILRSNARIADRLTLRAFERAEAAADIYKNYSGGKSILDFHHVIDGFKSMRTLDTTEAFKTEAISKLRKHYLEQQRRLAHSVSKFATSSAGLTNRLGNLYDDIQKIFRISDTGEAPKTLDELEDHLLNEVRKATGVNKDCEDIINNLLSTVRDAKKAVELAQKNDAQSWLTAMYSAESSKELRDLYTQYLSTNNAHAVSEIESVAVDRYKQLYAKEHNIDKDLVDVPDDMVLINAAKANDLDSVPFAKSSEKDSPVNSDLVAIPRFLGDAHQATQKAVSDVQDALDDLIKLDEKGEVVKNKNGTTQLVIDDYYVTDLFNYLQHVSKDDLSKLVISEASTKIRKALNSLKGRFGGDFSKLPNSASLAKLIKGSEDAEEVFVYSGGAELMKYVLDIGGGEYFGLVHTIVDSPVFYMPYELEVVGFKGGGPKLVKGKQKAFVKPSKLREAKGAHTEAQLIEEEHRTAYRAMRADPNGSYQKKLELRHKLETTSVTRKDGTVTTAYEEYKKIAHEFSKKAAGKQASAGLVNTLDIAFDDLSNAMALTSAQAEKVMEVNMAMSSFLNKVLDNSVLMDAVGKFDSSGPYGFLIDYKNEISDFLKQNVDAGREVPYINKLWNSIDSVETWCQSLNAYHNFHSTLDSLGLSPREMTAVLEDCLGNNSKHLHEWSRNPGAFFRHMEDRINMRLGSDNLLIDSYRETILRTSFLDESAWTAKHFDDVKSCEKELAEISESDVKLQILQAVELGSDTIKRFNNLAKHNDIWFVKPVVDGVSPDSSVIRFEMQKWVPVEEDISLADFLKVLKDNDKEYSHVFEISEELTEEAAIRNVVDILDKSVKSGPDVKHISVPTVVTHGRDVFDIDVLRQCCRRNNVDSVALSNTNALFKNRINTFKELMLQDKHHVCIDPDKMTKVFEATSKLVDDLPADTAYGIFNVSRFSKDVDDLFETFFDDALVKEVSDIYDCEHPIVKSIMDAQEEIKALQVDTYNEANMVQDITNKLDQMFAEDETILREVGDTLEENIREEEWRIKAIPLDDEEKAERLARVPENLTAEIEEDLAQIIPDYYGTLNHVTAGFESIKNSVSEVFIINKEAYDDLLSGNKSFEVGAGKFRDFYEGTTRHIVNIKNIVKELDTTVLPGTDINLTSLLSEQLKNDLDRFVNKELDDFGWSLVRDFSNETSLAHNMNACTYLEYNLDELLTRVKIEFDNIKIEGLELGDFTPKLPEKPVVKESKSSPWFRSLYQSYHTNNIINVIRENQAVRLAQEQKKLEILPETYALSEELTGAVEPLVLLGNTAGYGINPFAKHLDDFNFISDLVKRYVSDLKVNAKIPEAIVNNLTVLSKVFENVEQLTAPELRQFVGFLNIFQKDLSDMLTTLVRPNSGFDIISHVETTFSNYNLKSALLQQKLLTLQNSVTNRMFRETLSITESSPFIRDVFSPILDAKLTHGTGDMCAAVRDEVNNLNHIRASQANSCLTSEEFEGFGKYSEYDLPMGTSAELKYDITGQAFTVKKAYDIENARRIFNLEESREGSKILGPEELALPYNRPKSVVLEDTAVLLEEARRLTDSSNEIKTSIKSHQTELDRLQKADDLLSEREELLVKLEDFDTVEGYEEALKTATSKKYREQIVREQSEFNILSARLEEIDNELAELPEIDEKFWANNNYHNEMLARGKRNQEAILKQKQEVMDELMHNYELLKRSDTNDGIVITKTRERDLFQDIQKVIEEERDVYVRVPILMRDIPSHELMYLNKFANKVQNTLKYKLKDTSFLSKISTLDDWNGIINQTRKFAAALDPSHPYHYLVYLKEAETIEEAFIVSDMLYNMFYKRWDNIVNKGHSYIDKGLIHVPQKHKELVSKIMHDGYDSMEAFVSDNPGILRLLQGDGLDLVYKGQPKSYFDTVYYTGKINDKHSVAANASDILATKTAREGWANKFAPSEHTIREEAFAELENSQLKLLEVMDEVAGTPYERGVRMYLDSLQNGLYKAQALQVMDFITKDADHLITHLLYHNGHLNLALKYSDGFDVYGKYLTDLQKILDENPMFITYKKQDDYLWISLNKDANPRIINDTKHVKSDTQYELGGKTYDPAEMNEHYQHNGLPDNVEITEEMLKDIESKDVLIGHCQTLKDYAVDCYKKLDFLTEGAIRGSSITPYSFFKHRALRKAAPVDWLASSIRSSATCDQRLFHTSQFDFSIIGESEYRFKLGGQYDDTDILQNIKYCYDDLAGTVSTERMYIANFFDENSHCKLDKVFGPELSDADVLYILRNNPDQCILTLTADKNTLTGFRVNKLCVIDELSIRQARASNAIIADYETYVEMTRLINTSELDKLWMKAWARMVFFLKVGHLCNPGTWMRNWVDATIKATGEVDGNIAKTAINQVKAIHYLHEYNKIIKEVRDTYGVNHLTSKRLDNEWAGIQSRTGTKLTKRQFDFLESWLKVSLSGGESRMIQEMLKKQKYDPFRSGNLKPGDSFTSAGREAMKNEFDYLGSDLFRFEQIGEDEINNLISEGYRTGEEIFVDDFSAEEFWQIFNLRKNPETAYIDDINLFQKYADTVENILTIRSNNLFRGNQSLGSRIDYMCSTLLKPMSKVEQVVRLGQFLMLEKEGFTRSEIFKSIADTQFEYELKSSRVKYAELGITYFNFEYNNIRYWCNMLEEQPEYVYMLEKLWDGLSWQAAQEYYENEDFYNNKSLAYMMSNGALPIGSSGLYLKMFPSALGALNWFYGMPSQYMTSVVPPVEILSKEMLYRMGGDYADWLSNLDYSYSDQKKWEKALSLVPIAGTVYTRYIQHFKDRQPWTRLDSGTIGEALVKYNPTVWGAIYQYNKPHKDDFDSFQANLAKQGKWYDANIDRVVDISKKNTRGLNDPSLFASDGDFDRLCAMKALYRNQVWDQNWGGFVKQGHWVTPGKAYFDEDGNPKELGLNRYRDLRVPGEWDKLQEEMYKYHGRKWDANTDKFIPFFMWKEEKLNRDDLTWEERCEYMAEKGKYWDAKDHKFKSVPEAMSISQYNRGYYQRGWHNFKRWVNYGNNPPAAKYDNRRYNSNTTFSVKGKPFGYSYSVSDDNAALRMAVSGYKTYDEYYKFDYQYNYRYRMPNPLNHLRRYNPIVRYHIIPK